jgi:hypothetical protein
MQTVLKCLTPARYCFTLNRVGNQYAGDWKNGLMDGSGVLRFVHGDSYEGQFLRGFFYGQGVYTFKDGGYYEVRLLVYFGETPKTIFKRDR